MSAVDRMAEGYQPNFDIDYEIGRQGELYVARVIDSLRSGAIEVKTDDKAAQTGNAYLEVQCLYRGEWKRSGIAATQSDIWCHVVSEEVIVIAPTHRVRALARYYWGTRYQKDCKRGSHPTKGVVIPLRTFIERLVHGVPDEQGRLPRDGEVRIGTD